MLESSYALDHSKIFPFSTFLLSHRRFILLPESFYLCVSFNLAFWFLLLNNALDLVVWFHFCIFWSWSFFFEPWLVRPYSPLSCGGRWCDCCFEFILQSSAMFLPSSAVVFLGQLVWCRLGYTSAHCYVSHGQCLCSGSIFSVLFFSLSFWPSCKVYNFRRKTERNSSLHKQNPRLQSQYFPSLEIGWIWSVSG